MELTDEETSALINGNVGPEKTVVPQMERGWPPQPAPVPQRYRNVLLSFLAASPTIYLWSLPLLANVCQRNFMHSRASSMKTDNQCFVYKCDGYPACSDSEFGATVSSFISTPPATALFAAVFAWPLSYLWYVQRETDGDWLSWITMMMYQLSFGLFTVFNTYYFGEMHGLMQNATGLWGFLHYLTLARHCKKKGFWRVLTVLIFLLLSTGTFSCLFYAPVFLNISPKRISPWLCFCVECCGLSAMSVFPWVWELEKDTATTRRVADGGT